jgi:hypothetical protein
MMKKFLFVIIKPSLPKDFSMIMLGKEGLVYSKNMANNKKRIIFGKMRHI